MPEMSMIGVRLPQEWCQEIKDIAAATGCTQSELLREVVGEYLGRTDADSVKGSIADLQNRVVRLERRVRGWGS